MKKIFFLSVMLIILNCQSHPRKIDRNEFNIFSVSLIKRSEYNVDLLTCCFKTDQSTIFINKLKDYPIRDIDFPLAEKLGLNFSRWKVAKNDLDSTIFVIGLFINNFGITSLSNDSITLLTQKLKSDPRITIILENNDSIKLDRYDFKTHYIEDYFSVHNNWTGIDF